ncbi:tRNA (adenosine(37)-N6)-threonylcarbamoyltransferase complex ATPase subunit type 1 TsaE [Natronospora cellulosivora (SeqCode)]
MSEEIYYIESKSEEETLRLGETIGELLEPDQVVLLSGQLGAGKTVLTQGICNGLGVDEDVTSPTYNLINEYEGDLTVYHIDLYRLEHEEDLYDLGLEECFDSAAVVIIEWPDLAYDLIPPEFVYIKFEVADNDNREISIEGEGAKTEKLIERLEKYVDFRN